jgi:hypothetical protein
MTTLLFMVLITANPVPSGELKVALTPRGESECAARVGGTIPLVSAHRLVVQVDSKATAAAASLGGRLAVMTDAWAFSVSVKADNHGEVRPQASAYLTLQPSSVGRLELSARYSPLDDEKYLLAAAFSPTVSPVQVRLETHSSATSLSISFRPP